MRIGAHTDSSLTPRIPLVLANMPGRSDAHQTSPSKGGFYWFALRLASQCRPPSPPRQNAALSCSTVHDGYAKRLCGHSRHPSMDHQAHPHRSAQGAGPPLDLGRRAHQNARDFAIFSRLEGGCRVNFRLLLQITKLEYLFETINKVNQMKNQRKTHNTIVVIGILLSFAHSGLSGNDFKDGTECKYETGAGPDGKFGTPDDELSDCPDKLYGEAVKGGALGLATDARCGAFPNGGFCGNAIAAGGEGSE